MANYYCMFCTVKPVAPFVTFNGMLRHIEAAHPEKALVKEAGK